jgi:hypothetical protein
LRPGAEVSFGTIPRDVVARDFPTR